MFERCFSTLLSLSHEKLTSDHFPKTPPTATTKREIFFANCADHHSPTHVPTAPIMSHDVCHESHKTEQPSKLDREPVRNRKERHQVVIHHEPTFVDETYKLTSEESKNFGGMFFDYVESPSQVQCKVVRPSTRIPYTMPTYMRHDRDAFNAALDTSSEEEDIDTNAMMDTDSDPEEFDLHFHLEREKSPSMIADDGMSVYV